MVMVANHKSKGQVASDLEAFLGSDQAHTFTAWLWDALHAMNAGIYRYVRIYNKSLILFFFSFFLDSKKAEAKR